MQLEKFPDGLSTKNSRYVLKRSDKFGQSVAINSRTAIEQYFTTVSSFMESKNRKKIWIDKIH